MEPTSSGAPASDGDLAAAFRELQSALAQRDAELARRDRNRATFSRSMGILVAGILVGTLALAMVFDKETFKDRLEAKVSKNVPSILRNARESLTELLPVYERAVKPTWPAFSQRLSDTIGDEAGKLATAITPLASGDTNLYTAEADERLAKRLLVRFPNELRHDPVRAHALAKALREQQLLRVNSKTALQTSGPFAALHDMEVSLRTMGPPDGQLLSQGDTTRALASAALDVVKERLVSGENFLPDGSAGGRR